MCLGNSWTHTSWEGGCRTTSPIATGPGSFSRITVLPHAASSLASFHLHLMHSSVWTAGSPAEDKDPFHEEFQDVKMGNTGTFQSKTALKQVWFNSELSSPQ